jgi:hypothetical protein
MKDSRPTVLQLQADAVDPGVSVSLLLRKAKIVATKLDLSDVLLWIDSELNGYPGVSRNDLPAYRKLYGEPKARNPYHGWQPILFSSPKRAEIMSFAPISQAIGSIEESLNRAKHDADGTFWFPYSPAQKAHIIKLLPFSTDVQNEVNYNELYNILDSVRNYVLNWSLQLERAGVLGNDFRFTLNEKVEAASVTQNFIAQNIGVVGNVNDRSRVVNEQAAVGEEVKSHEVAEVMKQIREGLNLLPSKDIVALEPLLRAVDEEIRKSKPRTKIISDVLRSIRTICENVVGNVGAMGIATLISRVLG